MESITEKIVVCESCRQQVLRIHAIKKGNGKDGQQRYRCAVGRGCKVAPVEYQAETPREQSLALVPANVHLLIDVESQRVNLNAMHKASGESDTRDPRRWVVTEEAKAFIAALETVINSDSLQAQEGRNGGYWAHWQVGVKYAGYLSPMFAIRWNEYARLYLEGKARRPIEPSIAPDVLAQVGNGLVLILQTVVDQAITNRMGPMPQQTADNWETLQGVTVIEREVKTEVRIDLDFDGYDYVFVNDDTGQMAIGETYKTPQERINNGDYNGSKDGRKPWREAFAAKIDQRKKGQSLFQRYAEGMGVRRVRGDVYVKDDQFIADICQLPRKLRLNEVQMYVEQGHLFDPPMFR